MTVPVAAIRFASEGGMVFERRGAGRPVVFLHGWCLNRGLWMYQEELLAAEFDVISPDFAGFGLSGGLGGPYTFARYAGDVADLLSELNLQDVVLVGFAFGAVVALELASRGGERIAGVVSVAVPSGAHAPYDRMPPAMRRDWPDFCRRSARALFHNQPSDATLAWLENMFLATSLPTALETVTLMACLDPTAMAADVSVPQLFVHGANDRVSPRSIGEICVQRAPSARIEIVEDCGHAVPLEQKARFDGVLTRFLSAL